MQCLIIKCQWIQHGLLHLDNGENEVKWTSALNWTLNESHQIQEFDAPLLEFVLLEYNLMTLKPGYFGDAWHSHKKIDFLVGHVEELQE